MQYFQVFIDYYLDESAELQHEEKYVCGPDEQTVRSLLYPAIMKMYSNQDVDYELIEVSEDEYNVANVEDCIDLGSFANESLDPDLGGDDVGGASVQKGGEAPNFDDMVENLQDRYYELSDRFYSIPVPQTAEIGQRHNAVKGMLEKAKSSFDALDFWTCENLLDESEAEINKLTAGA